MHEIKHGCMKHQCSLTTSADVEQQCAAYGSWRALRHRLHADAAATTHKPAGWRVAFGTSDVPLIASTRRSQRRSQ